MKHLTFSILGLSMLVGLAVAEQPAAGRDEATLRALEQKWDAASLKGDSAAFGQIFADGFISTSAEGKVRTKAEMITQIKSGDVKYQVSKVDDMKVFVYGDAAVVNGRWTGKFVEKGKSVDTVERFTDTYVRQGGQWRCVASHGSAIK